MLNKNTFYERARTQINNFIEAFNKILGSDADETGIYIKLRDTFNQAIEEKDDKKLVLVCGEALTFLRNYPSQSQQNMDTMNMIKLLENLLEALKLEKGEICTAEQRQDYEEKQKEQLEEEREQRIREDERKNQENRLGEYVKSNKVAITDKLIDAYRAFGSGDNAMIHVACQIANLLNCNFVVTEVVKKIITDTYPYLVQEAQYIYQKQLNELKNAIKKAIKKAYNYLYDENMGALDNLCGFLQKNIFQDSENDCLKGYFDYTSLKEYSNDDNNNCCWGIYNFNLAGGKSQGFFDDNPVEEMKKLFILYFQYSNQHSSLPYAYDKIKLFGFIILRFYLGTCSNNGILDILTYYSDAHCGKDYINPTPQPNENKDKVLYRVLREMAKIAIYFQANNSSVNNIPADMFIAMLYGGLGSAEGGGVIWANKLDTETKESLLMLYFLFTEKLNNTYFKSKDELDKFKNKFKSALGCNQNDAGIEMCRLIESFDADLSQKERYLQKLEKEINTARISNNYPSTSISSHQNNERTPLLTPQQQQLTITVRYYYLETTVIRLSPDYSFTATANPSIRTKISQPLGEQYSPEKLTQEIIKKNDWSNISKVKITDTKGQTLIIEKGPLIREPLITERGESITSTRDKPLFLFSFWVKRYANDGTKRMLGNSQDIVLTL